MTEEIKSREANVMSISELLHLIRFILDSKFNEFLLLQDPERYTHFPEFVYSWFSSFYIDPKHKTLSKLTPEKRKYYSRNRMLEFYKDLMSCNFDQVWEVVTFREFLI